jgi:hypothetical protein
MPAACQADWTRIPPLGAAFRSHPRLASRCGAGADAHSTAASSVSIPSGHLRSSTPGTPLLRDDRQAVRPGERHNQPSGAPVAETACHVRGGLRRLRRDEFRIRATTVFAGRPAAQDPEERPHTRRPSASPRTPRARRSAIGQTVVGCSTEDRSRLPTVVTATGAPPSSTPARIKHDAGTSPGCLGEPPRSDAGAIRSTGDSRHRVRPCASLTVDGGSPALRSGLVPTVQPHGLGPVRPSGSLPSTASTLRDAGPRARARAAVRPLLPFSLDPRTGHGRSHPDRLDRGRNWTPTGRRPRMALLRLPATGQTRGRSSCNGSAPRRPAITPLPDNHRDHRRSDTPPATPARTAR